jgi:Fic family protein
MQIKFRPRYTITPAIARNLLRIEAAKEQIKHMPLTVHVLVSLRESMQLAATHYSTMIEGNQLTVAQVEQVIKHEKNFAGRKREEQEVKGYYCALQHIQQWAVRKKPVTQKLIQNLHALVMGAGKLRVKLDSYRDGQNVIRNSTNKTIVYMPPQAQDVEPLMAGLVRWITNTTNIPYPLVAGIAHYQFATIHPYYDGNGRTARLLTTFLLHETGYDLKGLYSLEEYYAQNLGAYYNALSIGSSHNYYEGRADADITPWLAYFIEGMATSFERVIHHMSREHNKKRTDQSGLIRQLDHKQRKVLELFEHSQTITAHQVGELFGFKPRTSAHLCSTWVTEGFLSIANPSNKARSYRLAEKFKKLVPA